MYEYYNPNPAGRNVGDCAVRAIAKALGLTWDEAYDELALAGKRMADMPNSDGVWGAVLRANGFYREGLPSTCPACYTAKDFSDHNPVGTYVLGFGGHVATVKDGTLYDSWNSSYEIPQFYWTR